MEYVKWKKYEKLNQEQQGWVNKNEIKFEEEYKEVETVGFNVSENDTWLTLAYSICNDEYLYPIQIHKSNIIERYELNKQVIEVDYKIQDFNSTLKVQEEISKELIKDEIRKIYNIDPDEFIEKYNQVPKRDLCVLFNLSRVNIERIIKCLIKAGYIEKHNKYWRKDLLKKTKERYVFNMSTFIDLYNKHCTVDYISKELNIPTSKIYSTIKELVTNKKVLPRRFYLGSYIYYTNEQDLKRQQQELKDSIYDVKEDKPASDIYIDVVPDFITGGRIKLQPSLNKTQFKQDMKTMSEQELSTKYERNSYVIKALINYFSGNEKSIKTVKFLVDKQTGYKWVFPTPLIIENYLKDKKIMTTSDLRLKYGLSGKVSMMLNNYLKEKGFVC